MLELWDRLPAGMRGTLKTLLTIALNGGCATLGAVVIDPEHFSLAHLKHLGIVFSVGALAAVVNWLRQSPWKKTDDNLINSIARSVPIIMVAALLGLAALTMPGCTRVHHVAVVADATFAQAVFAVDDAEFKACEMHVAPFTVEACAAANVKIKQALIDVKAVTAALQASPKDGTLPKNLPSLIGNLTELQAILSPLAPSVIKDDIANKIQYALRLAVAVLNSFAGAH